MSPVIYALWIWATKKTLANNSPNVCNTYNDVAIRDPFNPLNTNMTEISHLNREKLS